MSTSTSASTPRPKHVRFFIALVWLYGVVLVAVMLVRYGVADRCWWSFAANSLLLYAFLPAPLILLVAMLLRDRVGLAIAGLSALLFVGTPMTVEIDIRGTRIGFVNFHTYAGPVYTEMREKQAQALVEFAAEHPGPLIFVGDLNATDQNKAYAIISPTMHDAWREAGWGFGHTFPGKPTPDVGGSRPVVLGLPVPMWLVRIDYIFHSDSFITLDARLGPDDGGSDHRPVVARLAWSRIGRNN
jgi:hypothetical protein